MARDRFDLPEGSEIVGESQTVPGAVDVRTPDGRVIPVDPAALGGAMGREAAGGLLERLQTDTSNMPQFGEVQVRPAPDASSEPFLRDRPGVRAQAEALGPLPVTGEDRRDVAPIPEEPTPVLKTPEVERREAVNDMLRRQGTSTRVPTPEPEPTGPDMPTAAQMALREFVERESAIASFLGGTGEAGGAGASTVDTRTVQRRRVATPGGEEAAAEARGARMEAVDREQEAVRSAARALNSAAQDNSEITSKLADRLRTFDEATGQNLDERFTQKAAELSVQRDDMARRAQAEIDPRRFWKDASGPQRVGLIVGQALAGIGAALRNAGGQNVTPQNLIAQAIDRDIALQQQEIQNAQQGLGQADNALGSLRAQGGDFIQQRGALRDAMIDQTIKETAALAVAAGGVEHLERAEQLVQQLEQMKRTQQIEDLGQSLGTVVDTRVVQTGGGSAAADQLRSLIEERQKVETEGQIKTQQEQQAAREQVFVPGFRLRPDAPAPRPQVVEGIQRGVAGSEALRGAISRIEGILGETNLVERAIRGALTPEEIRQLQSETSGVVASLRRALMQGQGQISDREQMLIERMVGIGDLGTLVGAFKNELAGLRQTQQILEGNVRSAAHSVGLEPVGRGLPAGARVRSP